MQKEKDDNYVALFWLTKKHCPNWTLTINRDYSIAYETSRDCQHVKGDYELVVGDLPIRNALRHGVKTQSTSHDELRFRVDLKMVNNSGERLKISWIDYEGNLYDYSGNING